MILLILGVVGAVVFRPLADVEYVKFKNDKDRYVPGTIYKPINIIKEKKYPAVFLLPGINTPHTAMENLAIELSKRNYYVFAVYLPEWNPPKNLQTLKKGREYFFKKHPQADSGKTAYIGHSLGGTTAVDAAYNNKSAWAAASIGFYIGGELKTQPPNLLLGTGIYDDLNGPDKMKQSALSVTGGKLDGEGRTGYFRKKTVRELFYSPYSGHASEMSDPYIARKITEFLSLSFHGVAEKNKFISFPFYKISIMMLLFGSFMCTVPLVMIFSSRYEYYYRFIFLPLILIAGILLVFVPVNPVAVVRVFGILFLSFLISNYYMKKYDNSFVQAYKGFLVFFVRLAAVFAIFAFSFILTQFLFQAGLLFSSGKYLYAFPAYIVVTFILSLCSFMVSYILFIKHTASWIWIFPIAACLFIYFLETISQGWTLRNLFKKGEELRRFIRYKKGKKPSQKSIIILAICVITATIAWFWLMKAGLLQFQIMKDYIIFILRYLIIPLALTMFVRYRIKKAR